MTHSFRVRMHASLPPAVITSVCSPLVSDAGDCDVANEHIAGRRSGCTPGQNLSSDGRFEALQLRRTRRLRIYRRAEGAEWVRLFNQSRTFGAFAVLECSFLSVSQSRRKTFYCPDRWAKLLSFFGSVMRNSVPSPISELTSIFPWCCWMIL